MVSPPLKAMAVVVAFEGNGYAKFAKSAPATAAISAPPVVVFTNEPAAIFDIAKPVVVALVIVAMEASKFTKWDVEEANRPLCAQIGDVVAAVRIP